MIYNHTSKITNTEWNKEITPWNDDVRRACGNNARKEDLEM